MRDDRDYKLELSTATRFDEAVHSARPFLSVHFACCNAYCRIYRNVDGTRYEGRCPKCAKPVTFAVGPGGTDSRTFVVK